ncbi:MAG: hypothetical protein ACTSPH_06175 [Promethearchaeota archaeon]
MISFINNVKQREKKEFITILLLLIIFSSIVMIPNFQYLNNKAKQSESPKNSAIWATLDLVNPAGINNTRFYTGTMIIIKGRLYNRILNDGKSGYTVVLEIDGVQDSTFNNVTDANGYFQIGFTISQSFNVYSGHRLEARVISPTPPGEIEYRTHYIFYVNTTSYFDIVEPTTSKLLGEDFEFSGYLYYENGTAISYAPVYYYWYDNTFTLVDSGTVYTDSVGKIQGFSIPDVGTDQLTLTINYNDSPYVEFSEYVFTNPRIFQNISCIWDLPSPLIEGNNIIISGQVVSLTDGSVFIDNREIYLFYNGTYIGTTTTDNNGFFHYSFTIPSGIGLTYFGIHVVNSLNKMIYTTYYVNIQEAQTTITPPPTVPPLVLFLSIFIPIVAGIVIVLGGYGYYRYKKQEKESRVVRLPLENKIKNMKILKDTGRIEEALAYLFNAIYMELITAKFGRSRYETETIRDFAIVSVKELNLTPTVIYPFIQKVEEIIYGRPFEVSEKDFYNTVELFSPVFYELTGYNFVLNF